MGHIYKYLGSDEQAKQLWQNKEALLLYLERLKELMNEDNLCCLDSPDNIKKEPPLSCMG